MWSLLILASLAVADDARQVDKANADFERGRFEAAAKRAERVWARSADAAALDVLVLAELRLFAEAQSATPSDESVSPEAQARLSSLLEHVEALNQTKPDSLALAIAAYTLSTYIEGQRQPLLPLPDAECDTPAIAAFEEAEAHFAKQRWRDALDAYDRALAICPRDATAWTWSGDAVLQLGDPLGAIARYERAIAIEPCHHVAHRFKADVTLRLPTLERERYLQGIDAAVVSVACNPHYAPGWRTLGAYMSAGKRSTTSTPGYLLDPTTYGVLVTLARDQEGSPMARRVAAFDELAALNTPTGPTMERLRVFREQEDFAWILAFETLDAEIEAEYRDGRAEHLDILKAWVMSQRVQPERP